MKRAFRSLLALVISIGVFALAAAGPAAAASFDNHYVTAKDWHNGSYWCLENVTKVATGCLEVRGDYIEVGDLKTDSRRVGVYWETDYGRTGLCQNANGTDASISSKYTDFHARGKHLCNENWKENTHIRFKVGICNGSKWDCNQLKYWYYWSGMSRWYLNDN